MAKYKRSIKGGTFRPQQASERGEARLQEYSDRIIGALRDERDAVISNRNRIADAMKENAQIESQQASTNAKIQEQNVQTQLNAVQAQNAAAQRQFEIDTRAQQQIFGSVAKFSITAAQKLHEIEVEKQHEKWNQDYFQTLALGDNDPNVRYLEALLTDADAKKVEGYAALSDAKLNGADELDLSEAAQKIKDLSYGAKLALFNKVGSQYQSYLNQQFMDETTQYTDRDGNTFTGNQASRDANRTSIVAAQAMQRYLDLSQLTGTNPALLQKSGLLDKILSVNQSVMKTARENNLEDNNFRADNDFNYQIANAADSATVVRIIETEWIDLVNRKGFEGAHQYLTELFKSVDIDGNPIYNAESLFAAKLGEKGEAWGDKWSKRKAEIQRALATARTSALNQQEQLMQADAIQHYRSTQSELHEQLSAADPRDDLDILGTAKKAYMDRFEGFVPPQLVELERRVLAENKAEGEAKLEVVKQRARDGLLTQGEVLSIQDPTMRAEAQGLLVEQNKTTMFGSDYQVTLKALKQDAKLIAKDSLEGASSSAAVEVQLFMERQFAAWYKEGLANNNNDPTAALAYARQNHQSELAKSKAGSEDGLYLRKFDDNNGSVYPNIQVVKKRTEAVIDQNIERIENQVGATGIGALDSPGLVSSAPDLRNLSQTHYTGGSINALITPEIKAAARLLGISTVEVINRQINAFNKYNQDKIAPIQSPSLDIVNTSRPETQRLFTDNPTTRSVARGVAEASGDQLLTAQVLRKTFTTGNTGIGTGPHADFRVWDVERGQYIDPTPFLGRLTVNGKPLTEQFRMTSPYGMRTHPVTGEYKMHHGVDFATPIGTNVGVDAEYLETISDPTAGNMGIYSFDQDGRKYELHGLHGN